MENVPYIGETVTERYIPAGPSVTNVKVGGYVNIWPQIEADFMFAMQNLPAKQPEVGRINKWGAQAFLAKVYMFEGKLSARQAIT